MRVAILASGNGTNFEVLAQHFKNNDLPGELALLFCNDFIALAGYLRVIGPTILDHYAHRIINLHPAWLPEYPGLHSIERAFADQQAQTGVTVHYIDAGLDSGPIIAQEHVPILPTDTIETLEARVHETEHRLYPEALKQALEKEQH